MASSEAFRKSANSYKNSSERNHSPLQSKIKLYND